MENFLKQFTGTLLTLLIFLAGYGLACKTIDNHVLKIDSSEIGQAKDIPVLPILKEI